MPFVLVGLMQAITDAIQAHGVTVTHVHCSLNAAHTVLHCVIHLSNLLH